MRTREGKMQADSLKAMLESITLTLYQSGLSINLATSEFRKKFIIHALLDNRCNEVRAARVLGWHRNTLARNCADLEIDVNAMRKEMRNKKPAQSEGGGGNWQKTAMATS